VDKHHAANAADADARPIATIASLMLNRTKTSA